MAFDPSFELPGARGVPSERLSSTGRRGASARRLPWNRRLAVSQATTRRWSFRRDVMEFREARLHSVGVWLHKLLDVGVAEGAELLQSAGLSAASLSWVGGFTGGDGLSYLEAVQDACDTLETAATIGAECLIAVPGRRGLHTWNHAAGMVVDGLRRLGDEAGQADVQIAVQPFRPPRARETFLTSLHELLEVLDRCRHPRVGFVFDLFQLSQVPDLQDRIPELLPWIKTVQISDWAVPRYGAPEMLPPGEGTAPLADWITLLEQAGYRGRYELQLLSPAVWESDYRGLLMGARDAFLRYAAAPVV